MHVDLERSVDIPYNPTSITQILNRTFYNNNWHVRVLSTFVVPETFHCRFNAKSRTYLYRLAVRRSTTPKDTEKGFHYVNYIPIEEIDRCFFIQNPTFDVEKAQQVVELFRGRHDFRTFMGRSKTNTEFKAATFTWRRIDDFTIKRGVPCSTEYSNVKSTEKYDYWDITVTGSSFLYRQVRRMVGSVVAVAQGRLTYKDCYEMLTIPSQQSWCPQASVMAPYGLYLCRVDYNRKELFEAINAYQDVNRTELARSGINDELSE